MNLFSCVFVFQIFIFHDVFAFQNGALRWKGVFPEPQNWTAGNYQKWFPQILDHFNTSDSRTWNQRYYINNQYYTNGGPIFLFIGGEFPLESIWIERGSWIDYAKKFGAFLVLIEHRYYGESQPFQDTDPRNLKFLSSQQALADIATIIVAMKKQYQLPESSKCIAFGGSYAGNLAAWIRLKYPQLVHGAVSSSSPVLAVLDYSDYFRVVAEGLKIFNPESYSGVQQAFQQFDEALKNPNGRKYINQKFRLCTPIEESINIPNHIASLNMYLVYPFGAAIQHYHKHSTADLTFDIICDIMANTKLRPLDRLAQVSSLFMKSQGHECLPYTSYNRLRDGFELHFAWTYQTCTEFGYYQTLSAPPQIFGKVSLMYFIDGCSQDFGEEKDLEFVSNAIKKTNSIYQGKDINVTNVVFIHGSLDPWHPAGITETINPGAPAIFIEGTAHCSDMYPEMPDDLPQLKAARRQIQGYIHSWLQE